ncbi:MAG: glycosyltransferase family 2 protein [Candidatus Onthoplasma sp.]
MLKFKIKSGIKNIYKFANKLKYFCFQKLYKTKNLPTFEQANNYLISINKTKIVETNYNEKFKSEPRLDLSIIVPVYNVEKYIKSCVDSLMQDTSYTYEIILVDDGSTDSSAQLCDEIAKTNSLVRVFHTTNGGPSKARNIGIVESVGRHIMFVDSDDTLKPNSIQTLLDEAVSFPNYDIIQARYCRTANNKPYYKSKLISPENASKFNLEYGFMWGKIYKREIFENIKFPLNFWFEDIISDLVILPSFKTKLINFLAYNYNINPNSITQSARRSPKLLDSYFVLNEVENNFDKFKINFSDLHFKRLLYQASGQIYYRLRHREIELQKSVFVCLSQIVLDKFEIIKDNENKFNYFQKQLIKIFKTKNFNAWREISKFYN